jgi:transposase InsO family protein
MDQWAYDNQVTLDFSRPGKPTDNPFIESFNGSFRDECLNVTWFLSLADAKEKIQLHPQSLRYHFERLSLEGYISHVEVSISTGFDDVYSLKHKGREYLTRKNLI